MGYIDRRMSVNAEKAYNKGLLPRTKFSRQLLKENDWKYSVSFFNWLCKHAFIKPHEYHHTTPMVKCTAFYSIDTIRYVIDKYDLESLYDVYLNKCTMRDILRKKNVKRVRILVSRTLMHTKSDVYLDCLQYNNLYWWSKDRCFKVDNKGVAIVKEFDLDDFSTWHNPNREKIERKICTLKNYYRQPVV